MVSFVRPWLISLVLPLLALADLHASHASRHRALARRERGDMHLYKRFANSRWTFFEPNVGACGKPNVPSDFIVALNSAQYGKGYPGPECFKKIIMSYNGKTAEAVIMDECPTCPYGALDLTESLFKHFASTDLGIIYGSWEFADGSKPKSEKPKPAPKKPDPPKWKEPKPEQPKEKPKEKPKPAPPKEEPEPEPPKEEPKPKAAPPPARPKVSSSTSSSISASSQPSSSSISLPKVTPGVAGRLPGTPANAASKPSEPQRIDELGRAMLCLGGLVAAGNPKH